MTMKLEDPPKPDDHPPLNRSHLHRQREGLTLRRKFIRITRHPKTILIGAIAIILIGLFLIGYVPRTLHWEKLEDTAVKLEPTLVTIIYAKPDSTPVELLIPSTTQAHRMTPIWARSNGFLKNFYVDIGDIVHEGQLLVDIETPEIDKELSRAKADLANALAKLEIAKISSNRWQKLAEINLEAVSAQEVDERRTALQAASAEVNAAAENVKRLEEIQGFKHLYAPFEGVITTRNIDIGSLITAGSQGNVQQLYQLAKIDIIRVFASVPQPFFRSIKVGDAVDVFVNEFPNRVFKGIIARTSGSLDPDSRTLLTEIHVKNEDYALLTGLYAEVHFILTPAEPYYIVPTTSIIIREGLPHVALVGDQETVRIKKVKIGRDFGKNMEIISGLKENDKVITNPNEKIIDGAHVTIAEAVRK